MNKLRHILSTLLLVLGILLVHGRVCNAASVNVSTYDDLKKYLKSTDTNTITVTKNITITGEINVNGKKKLIGNGKQLLRDTKMKEGRLLDVAAGANLEISNLNLNGNNVSTSVNLIRVQEKATLTLAKDVKLSNAVSSNGGAAIGNYGTITTAAEFRSNTSAAKGGAIKNYAGATLTITGGKYAYNTAKDGGAVYVEEKSTCNLKGGDIYRNDCTRYGEAIYAASKVVVNGAPEFDSTNDIYIPAANAFTITNFTGTKKMPLYFYSDTVGTVMISNASKYVNNVMWSHNFSNPKKHIIVAYSGGLYVGRTILVTFHTEKDETCQTKSKTIKWGETYGTLPTPSRTGYNFVGWDVGKNVRPHITSSTVVKVDADITLYAEWSPKVIELNFNVNGGNPLNTVWNATYGKPISGLPKATRDGYEFIGWFNSPTGNIQYKDGDISKFATKTVLYAHWSPAKVVVTLDPMGGTVENNHVNVYYEQAFGTIETPVRPGYVFMGWSLTKEGDRLVTSATKVANKTAFSLYATWKPAVYTVTFDCAGGSVETKTLKVTYGQAYGILPVPKKTGHTFAGWYGDKEYKTRITSSSAVKATSHHTLYAKWTINSYFLLFDPNGGTITTTNKEVVYGKAVGSLPSPVRNGYLFKGWYTDKQNGERYVSSTVHRQAKTVTLYARWEKIKVVSLSVKGIKKAYNVKDTIQAKDLVVNAVYNDGKTEKNVSGYEITYTNKKTGKQTITIRYKGNQYKTSCYWYDKKTMQKAIGCKSKITLYAGEKTTIAIAKQMELNRYASFESSNKKIASVSKKGKVTAKKAGTAKIQVTYTVNGKKTSFIIKIKVKQPELKISWTQKKGQLHFKAKMKGCSNVTWKSSNKKVGTIDKKTGVFKPKKKGTTYIYATAGGIKRTVKIVVKNGMYECYTVS